jgi:hypothetical protein
VSDGIAGEGVHVVEMLLLGKCLAVRRLPALCADPLFLPDRAGTASCSEVAERGFALGMGKKRAMVKLGTRECLCLAFCFPAPALRLILLGWQVSRVMFEVR